MLSINLIARLARNERYDSLLEGLSSNGMAMPLSLRIRLTNTPAAVVALGLRRILELTAGPTQAANALLLQLLAMQLPDGSFDEDPVATAAAANVIELAIEGKAVSPADHDSLQSVRHHAFAALSAMQDHDALLYSRHDRTLADRTLGSALALWLVGSDELFRASIRYADLLTWFESNEDCLDPAADRFWQMAQLSSTSCVDAAIAHDLNHGRAAWGRHSFAPATPVDQPISAKTDVAAGEDAAERQSQPATDASRPRRKRRAAATAAAYDAIFATAA